jgi:hypothetical protein
MDNTGNVYYLDSYGTEYEVSWQPSGLTLGDIDITTIMRQPLVWGENYSFSGSTPEERGGYVADRKVYRRGTITVIRQIIRPNASGYEIVSQGSTQEIGYFTAKKQRQTKFSHYLNYEYVDSEQVGASEGPFFGDPDESYVMGAWVDPDAVAPSNPLYFIDVWGR